MYYRGVNAACPESWAREEIECHSHAGSGTRHRSRSSRNCPAGGGQCYAGNLKSLSDFAPKDWHEATNACAAEGKVLCGVEQPCKNKGCSYNNHYQWTGEECRAGDAGLPAECASA